MNANVQKMLTSLFVSSRSNNWWWVPLQVDVKNWEVQGLGFKQRAKLHRWTQRLQSFAPLSSEAF